MKRLYILRHAKAVSGEGKIDKERELDMQGHAEATALGKAMRDRFYTPQAVLCSSALRTRQTLEGVLRTLGAAPTVTYVDAIYTGGLGDVLHLVQGLSADVNAALVVGHNPSIHDLARLLCGSGPESLRNRMLSMYRPATLTVLDCPCASWAEIQPAENTLVDLLDPIDYNAPSGPTRWM